MTHDLCDADNFWAVTDDGRLYVVPCDTYADIYGPDDDTLDALLAAWRDAPEDVPFDPSDDALEQLGLTRVPVALRRRVGEEYYVA